MSVPSTCLVLAVPGPPQGQGRARIGKGANGRPVAYTPARTRAYAQQVQGEWIAAGRPVLIDGPFSLSVLVCHRRPPGHFLRDGSLSATGRRAPRPGKPDLDNAVKLLLDALCAVGALPDDRHLVDLTARKCWAARDDVAGVHLFAQTYLDADESEAA